MQLRRLATTDIELSPVVMGMWQAGAEYWVGIDDAESERAVRASLDAGVTAFDTAEDYGGGHSERVLGRALRGVRDRAVILSKVFSTHLAYREVIEACERSLANLGTDYIDLYQIHWPSGCWGGRPVPIADTMGALVALRAQGKIRAIGVSNFSLDELREAEACGPIASVQPPYSLFWRHIDADVGPYCRERGIAILAYSPLAQGLLTGRFAPGDRFPDTDPRADNKLFLPEHAKAVTGAVEALRGVAARKGCTMAQLALAWVIAQPHTFAIAGARTAAQAADNAGAAEVELTAGDLAELDRIGRPVSDRFAGDPVPWTWQPRR